MKASNAEPAGSVLVKQFILCQSRELIPNDWPSSEHLGWRVATHPTDGLPVIPITATCGSLVGWLIGYAVDEDDGVLERQLLIPADASDSDCPAVFEDRIYELAGRFLAVLLINDCARVYLDALGSLAAVYSERFQTICSSIAFLPEDGDGWENRELAAVLDIPRQARWYPFGLTPRLDASRLLPNHYLDLKTWKPVRHWPGPTSLTAVSEHGVADLEESIANDVETLLRRLSETGSITMALTAGRDSRLLLACSRPVNDRFEFYTLRQPDRNARMDCHVARQLARACGFRHRVVKWQQASDEELKEWLFRTGRCVAGRTWQAARTAREVGLGTLNVSGIAGEIGQAKYWSRFDLTKKNFTVEDLASAYSFPRVPQILAAGQQWLNTLPQRDPRTVADLFYIEQRVGCWATPQFYGHVAQKSHIIGFNHRRIIESFLRLPPEYRLAGALPGAVIGNRWPELLDPPFNQFTGPSALVDSLSSRVREFLNQRPRLRKLLAVGGRRT